MSHEAFASELFTEVSEEQQQIVAGGQDLLSVYGVPGISDSIYTNFSQHVDVQQLAFSQQSGPGGSAVGQVFTNQSADISTYASKYFNFSK